jgi:anti-sigma factor RsiW
MVESDPSNHDIHPEVTLLPWYLNGTLRHSERQQVAQHLAACSTCQAELEEMTRLRKQLQQAYTSQAAPSPQAFRATMARVAAIKDRERRPLPARESASSSWLSAVDGFFRSLFLPRWVPTLAATLIIVQLGLLLWSISQLPGPDRVTPRSVGPSTVRIRVVFQGTVTEPQIRSVLQDVTGRIVDGPTSDGFYIVEVPARDQVATQKKLETLRAMTDVIRQADQVQP